MNSGASEVRLPTLRGVVDASLLGYVVCLFAFPSSFGLTTPWFVLSPARLVLGMALVSALLDAGRVWRSERVIPWWPIVVGWLLFLGTASVSALLNRTDGGTARLASLVVEGAGTFWLVWWVGHRRPVFVHASLVATTCAIALITLAMSVVGFRYDLIFHGDAIANLRFGIIRQQASFDSALFLAVWMVAAGALSLGLALFRTGAARRLGMIAWIASILVIVTTVSRFAVTAVPIVAAVILLASGRIRLGAVAVTTSAIVAFVVFFGSVGNVNWDSGSPLGTSVPGASTGAHAPESTPVPGSDADILRGSNQARVEAMHLTIAAVQERPLFGWGLLSAKDVAKAKLGHLNYVDNGYLVFMIDTGLVGLVTFLALVGMILLDVVRRLRRRTGPLLLSQLVAFASLLAFSVVAAFWATSQGYAAFWIVASLAVATAEATVSDTSDAASDPSSGWLGRSREHAAGISTAAIP